MQKKALGRGLSDLNGGERAIVSAEKELIAIANDPSDLGPGLRVLVRQRNGLETRPSVSNDSATSKRWLSIVKISLTSADILLVICAWSLFQIPQTQPFGFLKFALIVVAVCLGCWLGCLGAWLHFDENALE